MLLYRIVRKIKRTITQTICLGTLLKAGQQPIKHHWVHINPKLPTRPISNIPKTIWMYWQSDQPNELVDLCIYSIKKYCGNSYDIKVLNNQSVQDYLELPTFHQDLKPAHIADYIRLSLLKEYGGIWLDASIFLTESLNWIFEKMEQEQADVFLSYCDACTLNKEFPVLDNWLIIAPPKHPFICDWLTEFNRAIFSESPTTYYQDYIGNEQIIQKIPNIDYLICYVSAMVVLNKKSYNILYANSGSGGHYYNYYLDWSRLYIPYVVLKKDKKRIPIPKMIKFTSGTRKSTEQWIKSKNYNPNSILGELLQEMMDK